MSGELSELIGTKGAVRNIVNNGISLERQNHINDCLKTLFSPSISFANRPFKDSCAKLNLLLSSNQEIQDNIDESSAQLANNTLKAKIYNTAFEGLRSSSGNKEQFLYYYNLLQLLEISRFHQVGEALTETQDIVVLRENSSIINKFKEDAKAGVEYRNHTLTSLLDSYTTSTRAEIQTQNRQKATFQGNQFVSNKTTAGFLTSEDRYWYENKDINSILGAQLRDSVQAGDNIFQMQAQGTNSPATIDIFATRLKQRIAEVNCPAKLVIPVNVEGNHWIGVILDLDENRKVGNATLMDSLPEENNNKMRTDIIEYILNKADILQPDAEIINKPVTRQRNGHDCGPWTIQNLVANSAKSMEQTFDVGLNIRNHHKQIVRQQGLSPSSPQTNITPEKTRQQGSPIPGDIPHQQRPSSQISASGRRDAIILNNILKTELGKNILQGAFANLDNKDVFIEQILGTPHTQQAVFSMVDRALTNANNGEQISNNSPIDPSKLNNLNGQLQDQARSLLAQIGNEKAGFYAGKDNYNNYPDDMRDLIDIDNEIAAAESMTAEIFQKNTIDALNNFNRLDQIKIEKQNSMMSRLKYGMLDGLSSTNPRNWSPEFSLYAAAAATILIPPPAGLAVAVYLAGKSFVTSKTGQGIIKSVGQVAKIAGTGLSGVAAAVVGASTAIGFGASIPLRLFDTTKKFAITFDQIEKNTKGTFEALQNSPKNISTAAFGKPVGKIHLSTKFQDNNLDKAFRTAAQKQNVKISAPKQSFSQQRGQTQPPMSKIAPSVQASAQTAGRNIPEINIGQIPPSQTPPPETTAPVQASVTNKDTTQQNIEQPPPSQTPPPKTKPGPINHKQDVRFSDYDPLRLFSGDNSFSMSFDDGISFDLPSEGDLFLNMAFVASIAVGTLTYGVGVSTAYSAALACDKASKTLDSINAQIKKEEAFLNEHIIPALPEIFPTLTPFARSITAILPKQSHFDAIFDKITPCFQKASAAFPTKMSVLAKNTDIVLDSVSKNADIMFNDMADSLNLHEDFPEFTHELSQTTDDPMAKQAATKSSTKKNRTTKIKKSTPKGIDKIIETMQSSGLSGVESSKERIKPDVKQNTKAEPSKGRA